MREEIRIPADILSSEAGFSGERAQCPLPNNSDGKEFGKGYTIGAYQLIVWGNDILKKKPGHEEEVRNISKDNGEQWALLSYPRL